MKGPAPWLLIWALSLTNAVEATAGSPADATRQGLRGLSEELRIVPSPTVERARLLRARAEELELALLKVDGVLDTHVQVLVPAFTLTGPPLHPSKPRVTVLIKHAAERAAPIGIEAVRALAMATVEGLSTQAVSVVFTQSESVPRPTPERLVNVGPLRVAADSRSRILGLLVGLAALSMLLSALLVVRSLPRRRTPPD